MEKPFGRFNLWAQLQLVHLFPPSHIEIQAQIKGWSESLLIDKWTD